MLMEGVRHWPAGQWAVVGSSLGGFYATVLAERLDCPAGLINPAVNPARDLAHYIGEIKAWHSEDRFWFRPEFVQELVDLTPQHLTRPERYFPIIATGDELLSWQEMAQRYAGSAARVVEGSDHALSDFAQHMPALLEFLWLWAPHAAP